MKTKVKKFNDLEYEERNKIVYYNNEAVILVYTQILNVYKNDITPALARQLKKCREHYKEFNKREYEQE